MRGADADALGHVIRRLRLAKALTQRAFADRLGKPSATVSAWELGKAMPEAANLVAAARVLGTTVSRLLTDAGIQADDETGVRREGGPEGAAAGAAVPCFDFDAVAADVGARPAGKPAFAVPRSRDNADPDAYALRIAGNALYPRFWDGDVVEVVTDASIQDGDLAVVVPATGRRSIRRVTIDARARRVRCAAVNPSETSFELPLSDVRLHKIISVKPRGTYSLAAGRRTKTAARPRRAPRRDRGQR